MTKNQQTNQERISQIKEKWYLLEPLYFIIFTTHQTFVNPEIKTIRSGNGKIEYNHIFIKNLSDNELETILRCELLRILLKHPYSRRKEISSISYEASNITLKEYMPKISFFKTAEEVFNTEEYNLKHFEFYYNKLLDQLAQQQKDSDENDGEEAVEGEQDSDGEQNSDGNSESAGEQNSDGNNENEQNSDANGEGENTSENEQNNEQDSSDTEQQGTEQQGTEQYQDKDIVGNENTRTWSDDDLMKNKINDHIATAQENNSWGSISGNMREEIIASSKPKADYRSILKAFRASILSQNRTLTRMKPSRRYGFQFMGSRRDFCTKLLFAVDVSGSMSNRDMATGFSVVNRLFKYGIEQVDVIQFDTEIKGECMSMKKAKSRISILGRGGTDFQAVINYIDENQQYDGVVVFTDGYAPRPLITKNRKTRILWLFNNENNYKYSLENLSKSGKCAYIYD